MHVDNARNSNRIIPSPSVLDLGYSEKQRLHGLGYSEQHRLSSTYLQLKSHDCNNYLAHPCMQVDSGTLKSTQKPLNLVVTNHDMANLTLSSTDSPPAEVSNIEKSMYSEPEGMEKEPDSLEPKLEHPHIGSLKKLDLVRGSSVISDLSFPCDTAKRVVQVKVASSLERLPLDPQSTTGSDEPIFYPEYYTVDRPVAENNA